MTQPADKEFPEWMFERPWDALLGYMMEVRQTANHIKAVAWFIQSDEKIAQMIIPSLGSKQATIAEIAVELDQYAESLFGTMDDLAQFRLALKKHLGINDPPLD